MNSLFAGSVSPPQSSSGTQGDKDRNMQLVQQLVLDLGNRDLRANALLELSKMKRSMVVKHVLAGTNISKELLVKGLQINLDFENVNSHAFSSLQNCVIFSRNQSQYQWCIAGLASVGYVFYPSEDLRGHNFELWERILAKEIISIYPLLSPPNLTPVQSNRVYNPLALLQHKFLYVHPFLNTTSNSRPFEYLRLTSLGIVGALVKVDDTEVISFLLSTEIIPLCLKTMQMGSELSKTVATFILQKILLEDVGLDYICMTAERFFAVAQVLGNMVAALAEQPSPRLLKHIIRCYLRLSDNRRACDALTSCLPDVLRDGTFSAAFQEDAPTRRWLQQLLDKVEGRRVALQARREFNHM